MWQGTGLIAGHVAVGILLFAADVLPADLAVFPITEFLPPDGAMRRLVYILPV